MELIDVINWLAHWLGQVGCSVSEFLWNAGRLAHEFFDTLYYYCTDMLPRLAWLAYDAFAVGEYIIEGIAWRLHKLFEALWERVTSLFEEWWGKVSWFFTELWERAVKLLDFWWGNVTHLLIEWWSYFTLLFDDWWTLVFEWFNEWADYFIWLFDEHKDKIAYILTDGWIRLVWLIIDRFEDLFAVFEGYIEGWQTFIDDPAQAIWNWFEPRAQELVAEFLARIW
jgi:hypothetical protein